MLCICRVRLGDNKPSLSLGEVLASLKVCLSMMCSIHIWVVCYEMLQCLHAFSLVVYRRGDWKSFPTYRLHYSSSCQSKYLLAVHGPIKTCMSCLLQKCCMIPNVRFCCWAMGMLNCDPVLRWTIIFVQKNKKNHYWCLHCINMILCSWTHHLLAFTNLHQDSASRWFMTCSSTTSCWSCKIHG